MNNTDKLRAYSLGLELGICESKDLRDFLDNVIVTEENPPYIFIDVLLNISKFPSQVQKCIDDNLYYMGYSCDITQRKDMNKFLLRIIGEKYRSGEFNIRQTTLKLYHLALKFNDYSEYMFFDDHIDLHPTYDIKKMLDEFFDSIDEFEDFN